MEDLLSMNQLIIGALFCAGTFFVWVISDFLSAHREFSKYASTALRKIEIFMEADKEWRQEAKRQLAEIEKRETECYKAFATRESLQRCFENTQRLGQQLAEIKGRLGVKCRKSTELHESIDKGPED